MNQPFPQDVEYGRDDLLDVAFRARGWESTRLACDGPQADSWTFHRDRYSVDVAPIGGGLLEVGYLDEGVLMFEPQYDRKPAADEVDQYIARLETSITATP